MDHMKLSLFCSFLILLLSSVISGKSSRLISRGWDPKLKQKMTTRSSKQKQGHKTSKIVAEEKEEVNRASVKRHAAGTSDQKQRRRTETSSQKQERISESDKQKRKETVTFPLQKQKDATATSLREKEEISGIADREKKTSLICERKKKEERAGISRQKREKEAIAPEQEHKATIVTPVQRQEKVTKTPMQEEKRRNVAQKEERIVRTSSQTSKALIPKERGTVETSAEEQELRTEIYFQKQKEITKTSMQKQEKVTETLVHKLEAAPMQKQEGALVQRQERTTVTSTHEQEGTHGVLDQKQGTTARTLIRKQKEIPMTSMQRHEGTTGTSEQKQKQTVGTPVQKQKVVPVQKQETTNENPMQKKEEITGTLVQKQETATGTIAQKQEETIKTSLRKEKKKKTVETLVHKEETTLETSVQEQERIPETTVQEETAKSGMQMQEEKLPDASENEKLEVSAASSMQMGPTINYVHPSTAPLFPCQEVQLRPIKMQIEASRAPLYNQIVQQYGPISVPPFPQQAATQISEASVHETVSILSYSVQSNMQMVETQLGPLYTQIPQQYEPIPVQPYPVQPEMQMVETRSGPLYSQVPRQYGLVPLLSQFPPPFPELIVPPMAGIPTHPLPGQVIPQFPPPVPGLAVPSIAGIPTYPLPGQVIPQFPPAVLPVPPIAGIPTELLPGEVARQFLPPLPGPPIAPGPIQVLQQFGVPHPGQFQLAPGPSMLPISGFPQYNQPYSQVPPRIFPGSKVKQFLNQTQQYKPRYRAKGVLVTEVTVHLSNPPTNLSVADNNLEHRKADTKEKNEPEEKKEQKATQVKFIYGEGSMVRIEVSETQDISKQSNIRSWPRARKHRRDKLVIRRQAKMIDELFLHGLSDSKSSEVECWDEKLDVSLENMPEKVLIKIFKFIAEERNNNPNVSINKMYRLKLICRRFNDVLENNAKALPLYQVSGLRIQPKKVGPLGYFTMVYRYGTGAFEPQCACLDLIDLPPFLRHDIINGFIHIDRMELTDRLFITLNKLTYGENVQKIIFSRIESISLTPESGICMFLDKFPRLSDLCFFGHYNENELDLNHSQVVMEMYRSEYGNGMLTGKEMRIMMESLKNKRKKQTKRSGIKTVVPRKTIFKESK
ncbi:unnamed protein product [Cercopithifilaria johnstoni]|uniref:F-box domain-containing protein n=1 Tax=Cercopithifilaria johnstoni TaxID=2874296 RepID=A0A8J2M6B7_9BILA|nr:unnamed protein product [Cercopithifilaria johnstoni]